LKRSHFRSYNLYPSAAPTKQSARIDPLTVLFAVSVAIGAGYIAKPYISPETSKAENSVEEDSAPSVPTKPLEPSIPGMPTTTPPGRPGNLTPEQEKKLQEFWLATLEIFGVTHEHTDAVNGAATIDTDSTAEDGKKKKKSRLAVFGKKPKDVETSSTTSSDDKYGQTKEFQHALANQKPEELRETFWSMVKHDDPDALLLRFLRARKWDVQNALVMLVSTMHWRSAEMHVDDDIMFNGETGAVKVAKTGTGAEKKDAEGFLEQLRMGKSFLHGTDSEGRPITVVSARLHKPGEQSEKSLERYTVFVIETARMLLRPPVDTATIIFDMTGFSMANMDYTPVKFMIKCFEANYPESLGSVLVYKAPWIFQGIWKIIKGWLDPVVASKVHFASDEKELSEWIPKARILKSLGGDENWDYNFVEPVEGEDNRMADTDTRNKIESQRKELVSSYERETIAWAKGGDGKVSATERTKIADSLRENYWTLDPYVRARSLYDRTGVIGPNGRLDFYPKVQDASAQAQGTTATTEEDLD